MSDYISKQAAIDAIRGWVKKAFEDWGNAETEIRCFNAIYPLIMALPSAQPEPQWIPCSERLPAYGEDVLISIGGYCNVGHIVSVNEEERYNWYFSGWYHLPNDVDAWMPLPEPWRGESNGRT